MQQYEYKTEVLTSMVGRDKLRMGDLESTLQKHGAEGWELVSLNLDADLRGMRDGHLLVFKRPVTEAEAARQEATPEVSDAFARGQADAERAASESD